MLVRWGEAWAQRKRYRSVSHVQSCFEDRLQLGDSVCVHGIGWDDL